VPSNTSSVVDFSHGFNNSLELDIRFGPCQFTKQNYDFAMQNCSVPKILNFGPLRTETKSLITLRPRMQKYSGP